MSAFSNKIVTLASASSLTPVVCFGGGAGLVYRGNFLQGFSLGVSSCLGKMEEKAGTHET